MIERPQDADYEPAGARTLPDGTLPLAERPNG